MKKITKTEEKCLHDKAIVKDKKYKPLLISLLVIAILLIITSIIFYNIGNEIWRLLGGFAFIFFLFIILIRYISYENRLKRYIKQNMGFDQIEAAVFSDE